MYGYSFGEYLFKDACKDAHMITIRSLFLTMVIGSTPSFVHASQLTAIVNGSDYGITMQTTHPITITHINGKPESKTIPADTIFDIQPSTAYRLQTTIPTTPQQIRFRIFYGGMSLEGLRLFESIENRTPYLTLDQDPEDRGRYVRGLQVTTSGKRARTLHTNSVIIRQSPRSDQLDVSVIAYNPQTDKTPEQTLSDLFISRSSDVKKL